MIKKHQYCFANISATKARIFMKFYVAVNYNVVLHEDPCTNARARVVIARMHVILPALLAYCFTHEVGGFLYHQILLEKKR